MNVQAMKETETQNGRDGSEKTAVKTTEYRSSAGKGVELRNVEVVHQSHPKTSGGVLVGAAAAVASTLESAKEAISRNK